MRESSFWITNPQPLKWVMFGPQVLPMLMEHEPRSTENHDQHNRQNQLLDLLIKPLKGCKGLHAHRQNLMQRVMRMPDLEVRDHLDWLKASHFPGT